MFSIGLAPASHGSARVVCHISGSLILRVIIAMLLRTGLLPIEPEQPFRHSFKQQLRCQYTGRAYHALAGSISSFATLTRFISWVYGIHFLVNGVFKSSLSDTMTIGQPPNGKHSIRCWIVFLLDLMVTSPCFEIMMLDHSWQKFQYMYFKYTLFNIKTSLHYY